MQQPQFQNQANRNQVENTYQQFYTERNTQASQDLHNALVKNGVNYNVGVDKQREQFYKQEELKKIEFEKEKEEREKEYKQSEQARYEQFKKEMIDFNNTNINALEVFELNKNYTLDDLKLRYKKLALKYHPDTGCKDPNKFKMISKAYVILKEKYNSRQVDRQHSEMKTGHTSYLDTQDKRQNFKLDPDKFDISKFNQLYEENKIKSCNEGGYGDWKTENTSEKPEQIFSEKFNLNMFNNAFNDSKQKESNAHKSQLIVYDEPMPSDKGTLMNFTNIADEKVSDFSSDVYGSLTFTDYKQAHTHTKLIDIDNITSQRKDYRSIEELEQDRGNIKYQMSDNDLMQYEEKKRMQQYKENERIQNIQYQDNVHEKHYNKLNKLMIGNFS
jgi:molecular chaperone DnaJ